ncbi:MAG: alpha-hydroxy acid oxidase [Pseudomonadota bacterium]
MAETIPRRLRRVWALDDLEPRARAFLPRPVFAYVSGTTERGATSRDVRVAFDALMLKPRVLVGVAARDQSAVLFGERWAAPFGIAPMGMCALAAYRGDRMLAAAAREAGIPMVVSATALTRLEEIAELYPRAWFQAYVPGETERIGRLLDRVAAAGFGTLVVTVDLPVASNAEHYQRAGFSSPVRPSLRLLAQGAVRPAWSLGTFLRTLALHGMPHFENSHAERGAPILARQAAREFGRRAHLDWSHIAAIRAHWQGRLIVKGMVAPEDARIAAGEGADAVWLSVHGGRQLDGAVAPLRMLAETVALCPGLPVILDSDIRRGTDALKALALGAHLVFVGRPMLYAAALGGQRGVAHAIGILRDEIDRNLALLGVRTLDELGPQHLVAVGPHAPPVRQAS